MGALAFSSHVRKLFPSIFLRNLSNYLEEYAFFFTTKFSAFFLKVCGETTFENFRIPQTKYQMSSKQTCLIRMRKKKKKN